MLFMNRHIFKLYTLKIKKEKEKEKEEEEEVRLVVPCKSLAWLGCLIQLAIAKFDLYV